MGRTKKISGMTEKRRREIKKHFSEMGKKKKKSTRETIRKGIRRDSLRLEVRTRQRGRLPTNARIQSLMSDSDFPQRSIL